MPKRRRLWIPQATGQERPTKVCYLQQAETEHDNRHSSCIQKIKDEWRKETQGRQNGGSCWKKL